MQVIIGSDYPKIVIPLIESAKRNVDIVIYDWRWYQDQIGHPVQQFNDSIVRASKRGVLVRAVINSASNLELLKSVGIKARILKDRRTLHTKLIIIDDTTLIIGSHNFTRNAFGANIETSIVTNIEPENTRLRDFFNNIYGL